MNALKMLRATLVTALVFVTQIQARCYDPSPAFPLPKHSLYSNSSILNSALSEVATELKEIIQDPKFDISSFSVEVTTSKSTIWSHHHTAVTKDPSRPGAVVVDGNSVYRMASVTKCFTTLAILQQAAAGNLSLDDSVNNYLKGLDGEIPWEDITLRTLASQLSGIPRDCG